MARDLLWAPWRTAYIASARGASFKRCLFCRLRRSRQDKKEHILSRGKRCFSVLNRYPYNNGHLLIAPYRHVGDLDGLRDEEWLEMLWLLNDSIRRMDKALKPHGYNAGINLGKAAGAGVPGHLHLHIVPRWSGDTNFMPVLTGTKVMSQSLNAALRALRQANGSKRRS